MISADPDFYVHGVLTRDKRLLAKTITLVESSLPEHQKLARTIVDRLLPETGRAVRLGKGPPGGRAGG
jgi:LAO/AO transport system kinase